MSQTPEIMSTSSSESESIDQPTRRESDSIIPFIYRKSINNNFSYASYANINVIVEHKIGYINATYLCDKVGKNFKHWMKENPYEEIIESLKIHVPVRRKKLIKEFITNSIKTSGHYIHPELMLYVGPWALPKFGVQISSETRRLHIQQATIEQDKLLQEKEELIEYLTKVVEEKKLLIKLNKDKLKKITK